MRNNFTVIVLSRHLPELGVNEDFDKLPPVLRNQVALETFYRILRASLR